MNTDTLMNGSMVKNHTRIQCNTENFVPIVVLGLSTSSSSSLPSSTSMTPSRQEIDHPTSSSSSSTSPTMTVSSDSETGAREDLSGVDSHPVPLSSSLRCCPSQPKIPNQIITKVTILNGATRCIPTSRSGCKNSEKISWMMKFLDWTWRLTRQFFS